jgi:hypothetical protein
MSGTTGGLPGGCGSPGCCALRRDRAACDRTVKLIAAAGGKKIATARDCRDPAEKIQNDVAPELVCDRLDEPSACPCVWHANKNKSHRARGESNETDRPIGIHVRLLAATETYETNSECIGSILNA